MKELGRHSQLRREFPEPPRTASVLAQCVSGAARFARGFDLPELQVVLQTLDSLPDLSGCRAAVGARYRQSVRPGQSLGEVREALALEPESDHTVWIAYSVHLNAVGKKEEAAAVLHEGIQRSAHPIHALLLQLQLVSQRELMGDSAGARKLRTAIGTAVARDGRPWLKWRYLDDLAEATKNAGDIAGMDSLLRERVTVARRARATEAECFSLYYLGWTRLDLRHDPTAALVPLTRSIALAEKIGSPYFITMVYERRARAFLQVGDFQRAEPDIRRALSVTPANDWYSLAEAHQTLTYVHEGLGRWPEAVREADRFRWHARELSRVWLDSPMYMMSLRAGGMIRWKAGWHAAARESFEMMVQTIEELGHSFYYAGEYYERIGDFARAMTYYRRGVAQDNWNDRPLNLAGLTRMFEALGMRDSARAAAERHDLPAYSQGTSRLLPSILLADGRVDEALRLARKDVDEQEAKRSAVGTASARLGLARLLLDAGQPSDAVREGATAERMATAAMLTDATIDALLVQGLAQLREGSTESITTLLRARAVVRAHPTATATMKVESALGDAYAVFGRSGDALIAYDRAATASQRVTATYESALDRARNREQRVALFDGALRVLLAMPESSSRSAQLFAWSARKKDALFIGTGAVGAPARTRATLTDIQRTLDGGTAVVNYIAVDSGIFALVITARAARMVRLPLNVLATSDLVQRLRQPLVAVDAGQLDLARAPFDLGLAQRLYAGLFAPLENMLGGVQRIIIVPDGLLYGVPFGALPRTPPGPLAGRNAYVAADYLIDRFTLTVSTVAALAGVHRSRGVAEGARVLVVRGPVAGGEREVASITAAWPAGRTTSIGGSAATEGALRKRVAGRSVIHFAVHAHADEGDPLASYLELARDSSDDGFLHVTEIAALKFRGDLVVLTGCETMPGRVFAGTGPFGIANGFIAAGARNVIATHWPVGESAAELSRDLHRALASGAAASDALRSAQLRLRRDPARAHPFYWGGYVLVAGADR